MAETTPLTFSDDQLLEALKASPEEVKRIVMSIAMQIELIERRAADEEDEDG